MKVSFVSSQAISHALRYQMLRMQADLIKAEKEALSGRVADVGLALGARTGLSVSMNREIERLEGLADSNQLASFAARLHPARPAAAHHGGAGASIDFRHGRGRYC
jgi:flagellar hook-associated protein 3 FlgL